MLYVFRVNRGHRLREKRNMTTVGKVGRETEVLFTETIRVKNDTKEHLLLLCSPRETQTLMFGTQQPIIPFPVVS